MKDYCNHQDCHIRASFNIKGKHAKYCIKHKKDDMIDVKNKKVSNE